MRLDKLHQAVGNSCVSPSLKKSAAIPKSSPISVESLHPAQADTQQPELSVKEPLTLPKLRSDLELHPIRPGGQGSPHWVISDIIRGRYFKLGWVEYELIARWSLGLADTILESVK